MLALVVLGGWLLRPGPGVRADGITVAQVIDGDTIEVDTPEGRRKVRLLRIDTPERGEPGYGEASRALRELLPRGAPVRLEFEGRREDPYGRTLAYVHVEGRNVSLEMVRQGWSPFDRRFGVGRYRRDLDRAEREARDAGRGMWGRERGWGIVP